MRDRQKRESAERREVGEPQIEKPTSPFDIRHSSRDVGGISAPLKQPPVTCPFCSASDVELFSLFGSQLLTSEYYCRNCRTVFEHVK